MYALILLTIKTYIERLSKLMMCAPDSVLQIILYGLFTLDLNSEINKR